MKVHLVFPPYWAFASPYLAIPSLAGFLRKHEVDTEVFDLNIETVDNLLSTVFLSQAIEVITRRMKSSSSYYGIPHDHLLSLISTSELITPLCGDI